MNIRGPLNSAPTFAAFFGVFVSARTRLRARLPLVCTIALVALLPTNVQAATFNVDNTTDAVDATPGNGVCATAAAQCTLRAAIQESNALAGSDTVNVPAGTYTLTIAGTGEDAAASGDLDITGDIIINGNAVSSTIIDANAIDRVFEIPGASTLTMSNVMVRGGNVPGNGGGIRNISGTLDLTEVALTGNYADNRGGGIQNGNGTLTLTNITISGNEGKKRGGAINHDGGTATLTNVTISGNTSESGSLQTNSPITVKNIVVADTTGSGNCDGNTSITSLGYNIDSGNTCGFTGAGDLINTDPLLGPLQDNGGPTFTHELLAGSPAIDAGTNVGCPATDQRGIGRPDDEPSRTRTHAIPDSNESEINEADRP